VQRKDARGVIARRKEAQDAGKETVPQLVVGEWAAAQDRLNQNYTFPFLLCKLIDAGSGSCVVKQVEDRETVDKCRFDPGDFMLAVRWYSRDPDDPHGRTFERAEKGMLNSTELREHGFELNKLALESDPKDDENDDASFASVYREQFEMPSEIEQQILDKCW